MSKGNQHASDREYDAALAIDVAGNFTGLRLTMTDDYGAYLSTNADAGPLCGIIFPILISVSDAPASYFCA